MIRFIMRHREKRGPNLPVTESFSTFTANVPQLERALTYGSYGEDAFERVDLLGAEVVPDPEEEEALRAQEAEARSYMEAEVTP